MKDSFFDSNVLLYLALNDTRKAVATEHLVSQGGWISVQVLTEIANVARRKYLKPWNEVNSFLELVRSILDVIPLTVDVHERGLLLAARYRLSVYDGMVVAAALATSCVTLWSEDMQHGLLVDGRLRIQNPFVDLR